MPNHDTTAAGVTNTAGPTRHGQVPGWFLVLQWSRDEPERVGESAPCPMFQTRFVGRGDDDAIEEFIPFGQHRPGLPLREPSPEACLEGDSISRRQMSVHATPAGVDIKIVGRCRTFVNGVRLEKDQTARLLHGHTVYFNGVGLLMCVRRPQELPGAGGPMHPYGGPDVLGIVGESYWAWWLRALLRSVGATNDDVLLLGERGTGKETAAAAIHQCSMRAKRAYVKHSAPAMTAAILELQLFGRIANNVNVGEAAQQGLLGKAHTGTLFFDEIGDMDLRAQAMLLRVMQEREYLVMGDKAPREVDVRFIGATNQDPGIFRPDFYDRFPERVRIPPLRERPEDIPLILRHLLRERAQNVPAVSRFLQAGRDGSLQPRLSGSFVDYLVRHPLPGNVRELKNTMIEAIKASDGDELRLPETGTTYPPASTPPSGPSSTPASVPSSGNDGRLLRPGAEELAAALEAAGWSVSAVARNYDVQRAVVYRWMDAYGLKRPGGAKPEGGKAEETNP